MYAMHVLGLLYRLFMEYSCCGVGLCAGCAESEYITCGYMQ
jgi:hypothetical protein